MIREKAKYSNGTGFTLVEMMVVLAISSILLTMAVPSLRTMVQRNQIDIVTNELVIALFYVRSEALKRNMDVVLCVSNADGSDCESDADKFNYANGWLIYMDCNGNGDFDQLAFTCDLNRDGTNDTAELLRVHEKLDTDLTVTGNGNYAGEIGYMMNGRVRGIGGSLSIDLLSINSNLVSVKKVVIANSGRIRTEIVSE